MIPTVITSGFRRSGIYPFNPRALDYRASQSHEKTTTPGQVSAANSNANSHQATSTSTTDAEALVLIFTTKEEERS